MKEQELRELDAWIAEHVMGGKPDPSKSVPFSSEQYCHPHYTTDPAAAMAVLEKCAEFQENGVYKNSKGNWQIRSVKGGETIVKEAKTLPLAICLFAKQLFGKEAK